MKAKNNGVNVEAKNDAVVNSDDCLVEPPNSEHRFQLPLSGRVQKHPVALFVVQLLVFYCLFYSGSIMPWTLAAMSMLAIVAIVLAWAGAISLLRSSRDFSVRTLVALGLLALNVEAVVVTAQILRYVGSTSVPNGAG